MSSQRRRPAVYAPAVPVSRIWPVLAALVLLADAGAAAASLRFFGHGTGDIDRVKIRIDDPADSAPGPPVDVGATDFTLEFFLRADAADNVQGGSVTCNAPNIDWIYGNIVFDRDRFNQDRKFGVSIADDVILFGVSGDGTGDFTICGTTDVLDGVWHHVALQRRRSDGRMWLYTDGQLEGQADGPDGDVSYPDDGVPGSYCGTGGTDPCVDSDPFLVIGAEKHDAGSSFPSFNGFVDEVRVSAALRYTTASFAVPTLRFTSDADTVGLYHFDEQETGACTGAILDVSGASGGPSDGECRYGGATPSGPVYTTGMPFWSPPPVPSASLRGLAALAFAILVAGVAFQRVRRRPGRS